MIAVISAIVDRIPAIKLLRCFPPARGLSISEALRWFEHLPIELDIGSEEQFFKTSAEGALTYTLIPSPEEERRTRALARIDAIDQALYDARDWVLNLGEVEKKHLAVMLHYGENIPILPDPFQKVD